MSVDKRDPTFFVDELSRRVVAMVERSHQIQGMPLTVVDRDSPIGLLQLAQAYRDEGNVAIFITSFSFLVMKFHYTSNKITILEFFL